MKTYDSGYKGKKKLSSGNEEGGLDFARGVVSSISQEKIQRIMANNNSREAAVSKSDEEAEGLKDNKEKEQKFVNDAQQDPDTRKSESDKSEGQDENDGLLLDETDTEQLERQQMSLESLPWTAKMLAGDRKPKLKFKYRLMRMFWPPWWGRMGKERMVNFLTCKLRVKSPFVEGNGKPKKVTKYLFRDVIKYDVSNAVVVGVGNQPTVANQVTVRQFAINPNNSYTINYNMYNVADQMVVTDGNGVQIANTGLVRNQGSVQIPVGTQGPITVTVTPGPGANTQYDYQVLMNPQNVTVRKRVYLWGFIPIFKGFKRSIIPFNPTRNYTTRKRWRERTWKQRAGTGAE